MGEIYKLRCNIMPLTMFKFIKTDIKSITFGEVYFVDSVKIYKDSFEIEFKDDNGNINIISDLSGIRIINGNAIKSQIKTNVMKKNEPTYFRVRVKSDDRVVLVYKLLLGGYCNAHDHSTVYNENNLEFLEGNDNNKNDLTLNKKRIS
jgi:hypothetical protein